MKEKIFDKMKEYGWNLENFNKVYDIHYNFIDNAYNYISEENYDFSMQDISKSGFESMVDFMSDFLRAINDIDDDTKLVGNGKISLTNEHNIPLSLGYITYGNVAQLETEIRKCKFRARDIMCMLNQNKNRLYLTTDYWQVALETENIIILKSNDNHYLEISTLK